MLSSEGCSNQTILPLKLIPLLIWQSSITLQESMKRQTLIWSKCIKCPGACREQTKVVFSVWLQLCRFHCLGRWRVNHMSQRACLCFFRRCKKMTILLPLACYRLMLNGLFIKTASLRYRWHTSMKLLTEGGLQFQSATYRNETLKILNAYFLIASDQF